MASPRTGNARRAAIAGSVALVVVLMLAPAAANALGTDLQTSENPALATPATGLPATMQEGVGECQIETATLGWGLKQSFRQYITGSIAHGGWTLFGDTQYIEPALSDTGAVQPGSDLFAWSSGAGTVANTLTAGTVSFVGGVHFSGHDGALELNIANPAIEFESPSTGYLLLAVSEAPAGEEVTQVRAAKLDLDGRIDASGTRLEVADAPVALTAEGADALNGGRGTYVAGEEMDPISLSATVSGCELGEMAITVVPEDDAEPGQVPTPIAADPAEPAFPWLPVILGGIALVVIGVAAGLLIAGRGKGTQGPGAAGPVDGGGSGE